MSLLGGQTRAFLAAIGYILAALGFFLSILAGSLDNKDDFPSTISSMVEDFLSPSGRIFFGFMLLGGIFILLSWQTTHFHFPFIDNSYYAYGAEIVDWIPNFDNPIKTRDRKIYHLFFALGITMLGTIPTDSEPSSGGDWIMLTIHFVAALCCFLLWPLSEIWRLGFTFCTCDTEPKDEDLLNTEGNVVFSLKDYWWTRKNLPRQSCKCFLCMVLCVWIRVNWIRRWVRLLLSFLAIVFFLLFCTFMAINVMDLHETFNINEQTGHKYSFFTELFAATFTIVDLGVCLFTLHYYREVKVVEINALGRRGIRKSVTMEFEDDSKDRLLAPNDQENQETTV